MASEFEEQNTRIASGIVVLVLFVWIIAKFAGCSCSFEDKKKDSYTPSSSYSSSSSSNYSDHSSEAEMFTALDMADKFAKQECQYPESVEFAYGTNAKDAVTKIGNHSYRVKHHITAQNGFGVKTRVDYLCELHLKEGSSSTWVCDSCLLIE